MINNSLMKILAVIPARYQSTRLPGKVMLNIGGKSLIQRVFEQVSKCHFFDTEFRCNGFSLSWKTSESDGLSNRFETLSGLRARSAANAANNPAQNGGFFYRQAQIQTAAPDVIQHPGPHTNAQYCRYFGEYQDGSGQFQT